MRTLIGSEQSDWFGDISHLIIDEVHERELVTDIILLIIKKVLQMKPSLKVVLMSATMDAKQFSEYFFGCPVIDVAGRMFQVETLFLGDVLVTTKYNMDEITTNQTSINALQEYEKTHKTNKIDHALLQHVIIHIHEKLANGGILVFLPGYEDIMMQKDMLENSFSIKKVNNYQLFVLHSGVDASTAGQARVFERMPQGIRKIILSTNIAETSLTIDDVV